MTKFVSVNNPIISMGKMYWLVMSPVGLDTFVYWTLADQSKNECLVSANGGQTWFYPHTPQDLFTVYIK